MDRITAIRRSENMRRIKSTHTAPEQAVGKLVRALGCRFLLHDCTLPGKPDIVFPRRHKVIFVHGCFWHQHTRCKEGRLPHSRQDYWKPKLNRNVDRDKKNRRELRKLGWATLIVWECELEAEESLKRKLVDFITSKIRIPKRAKRKPLL